MNNQIHKIINVLAKIFAVFLIVSIIGGIINAVFNIGDGIFGIKEHNKNSSSYEMSGDLDFEDGKGLIIDTKAVNISITAGDSFSYNTDNEYISVDEDDDKIIIMEAKHKINSDNVTRLDIVLPRDKVFANIKLDLGAGSINVESLAAENFEFDSGAFEVEFGKLVVTNHAKIDTGVGNITIKDGEINNLKLDLGMGNAKLNAKLTGNTSFDCGVGNLDLNIKGTKDDYTISVNKGLGNVRIDGQAAKDGDIVGNGASNIELNGGVGDISLTYSDSGSLKV